METQELLQDRAAELSRKAFEVATSSHALAVLVDLYRASDCRGGSEYGLEGVGDALAHMTAKVSEAAECAERCWDSQLWPALRDSDREREAELEARKVGRPAIFTQSGPPHDV